MGRNRSFRASRSLALACVSSGPSWMRKLTRLLYSHLYVYITTPPKGSGVLDSKCLSVVFFSCCSSSSLSFFFLLLPQISSGPVYLFFVVPLSHSKGPITLGESDMSDMELMLAEALEEWFPCWSGVGRAAIYPSLYKSRFDEWKSYEINWKIWKLPFKSER